MTGLSSKCHELSTPHENSTPIFAEEIDDYNRYYPGLISCEFNPSKEKYKNMLHLLAYDIREAKRLRKVATTCEDFGIRIEYSVFECDLDDKNFAKLWNRLTSIIDPDSDCIIAYKICSSCVTKITSIGAISRPGKPLLYIL